MFLTMSMLFSRRDAPFGTRTTHSRSVADSTDRSRILPKSSFTRQVHAKFGLKCFVDVVLDSAPVLTAGRDGAHAVPRHDEPAVPGCAFVLLGGESALLRGFSCHLTCCSRPPCRTRSNTRCNWCKLPRARQGFDAHNRLTNPVCFQVGGVQEADQGRGQSAVHRR